MAENGGSNGRCRVVLTGGPGGGKTTAADLFRRELGGRVVVVPEAATMLFAGGFPRVTEPHARMAAQRAIYHVQRNLEDVQAASYPDRILLCDRGTIDGAAYWPTEPAAYFAAVGSTMARELDRYDAAIFFESAAVGHLGIEGGNPARIESIAEAAALDARLQTLWRAHPRFILVPHNASFFKKITHGLSVLEDIVGERGESRAVMKSSTERLRVLVVEDDASTRATLRQAIVALGHGCEVAVNGAEAWCALRQEDFDVVVSDWRMPEMDGLELCRHIRAAHLSSYVYFIFVTAFDDRAHFVEGTRAGADDYLRKPVDLDELEARLASAERVLTLHSRLAEANERLRRDGETERACARTDPLTHVGNRLRMTEDLATLRSRAARYGHKYCAGLADVDLFKAFNDQHGHLAGDEALRRVADTIRRALRGGDALYRYGGEEFLIVLPEQSLHEACAVLDRVRAAVQREAGVTISIGVAELSPADDGAWEPWIARADAALYVAKGNGRNRVESAPRSG